MRSRPFFLVSFILASLWLSACSRGVARVLPSATPPFVPLSAQTPDVPSPTLAPAPTSTATPLPSPVYTATPSPTQTPTVLPVLQEPCISYYDATLGDLKLVCRQFDNYWRPIQTVDSEGNVGLFSSLAFDAQSSAHIAYYAMDTGDLKYARQTDAGWLLETVDATGDIALIEKVGLLESPPGVIYLHENPEQFRTSMGIDARGYPVVSYIGNIEKNLKVAWWNGTDWETKLVDPAAPSGGYNSLAISPQGYPAISYHDIEQGTLRYAWWDGRKWQTETVHKYGTNIGLFTSLAFDSAGRPHISYFDDDPDTLLYAFWKNNAWQIRAMTPGLYHPGFFSSLALDANDRPLVAYFEFSEADLLVAAWDGAVFRRTFVDQVGSMGWYPSLRFRPVYP